MIARSAILGLVLLTAGGARAATLRMFSYDPANSETRAASGPLTIEFRQGLMRTTVISVRSTEAEATVDLRASPDAALGVKGLAGQIGAKASGRDLYQIMTTREGAPLISALCPGSGSAWMALGRPRYAQDMRIYVFGDQPGRPGTRLCRTLDFTFRGEWRLPPSGRFDANLFPRLNGTRF